MPEAKQLAAIGRAAVVKPTAVPERFCPSVADPFDKLMPVHIHKAMAAYEVRKVEMVNKEVGRIKEATNLLNDILSSMNLPAGLEDTSGGGIADTIAQLELVIISALSVQVFRQVSWRNQPALSLAAALTIWTS